MQALKEGDLVQLKLGGPEMLVVGVDTDFPLADAGGGGVFCVWETDHLLHEKTFFQEELDLLPSSQRSYDRNGQILIPGARIL